MKHIRRLYAGLIYLFLYAPILVLIIQSFNKSRSRGVWEGFTLEWYSALFEDKQILSALSTSLTVGVLSAVGATVIGTFAAMGIHALGRRSRQVVMQMTYLPVLSPDIVTGISLMLLFIFLRFRLGYGTLLLAHISFNVPFVILSVLPRLRSMNRFLYEAALDLGAKPMQAFAKVVLPEIMPGVISGMLLAFTMSLDDFVISFFTTGSGVQNLSIAIYSMARRGVNPKINAVSTLLFAVVLLLLMLVNLRGGKDENGRGPLERFL